MRFGIDSNGIIHYDYVNTYPYKMKDISMNIFREVPIPFTRLAFGAINTFKHTIDKKCKLSRLFLSLEPAGSVKVIELTLNGVGIPTNIDIKKLEQRNQIDMIFEKGDVLSITFKCIKSPQPGPAIVLRKAIFEEFAEPKGFDEIDEALLDKIGR